jgi:signal transduction histidine kinase
MIAGQERERERIGRELHDNISQVLTTVKLYLEMASKQEGQAFVARSMQLVNSSITEIRNLSHQLSAPTLGTRSLIDAINALIETVGYSSNLVFEFDHSGYSDQLNMSQKLALYRIVQEQMNNILKHANATRVWISLNQKNGRVLLTVRDNGEGFDPGVRSNGMGLNNITSRIKVFDGDVHIESAPKKGCFLKVSFPLAVSKEEEDVIHNRSVIANYEEPTIS